MTSHVLHQVVAHDPATAVAMIAFGFTYGFLLRSILALRSRRKQLAAELARIHAVRPAPTRITRDICGELLELAVTDPERRHFDPAEGCLRFDRRVGSRNLSVWVLQRRVGLPPVVKRAEWSTPATPVPDSTDTDS